MPPPNLFKWRHCEPELIRLCVRWYIRYSLSHRDLEEMMRNRGLSVDHTTIYRRVQYYASEVETRWKRLLRRTNALYRIDEIYLQVSGAWKYLYRTADPNGDALSFLLRTWRYGRRHRVLTQDAGSVPRHSAAGNRRRQESRLGTFDTAHKEGLTPGPTRVRQCRYLNDIVEQDGQFIKRRSRPTLGFRRFRTSWRILQGIEMMNALRKDQTRRISKGHIVFQTRLIRRVFGLVA